MSEDEWNMWRHEPLTRQFFSSLEHAVEHFKEEWAKGNYATEDPQQTQNMQMRAQGALAALYDIIDMDYEFYRDWIGNED